MPSQAAPLPENQEPPKGLPPVQPPSGKFILQLFLVPGVIVVLAVLLLLAFRYAIGSGYTPASFLRQIDSDNADIRWRGASDLAQVLKRPESVSLKTDAPFALDLAERLKSAFDDLVRKEADLQAAQAGKPQEERDAAWRKLKAERNHVRFLAASLGDFLVPIGVPVLSEIVLHEKSPDLQGNTLRRRQAVWAMGHLGANVKEFQKLPQERKTEILEALDAETKSENPRRAAWARNALFYLAPKDGVAQIIDDLVFVDRVLAQAAKAEDRYLREQIALTISFWDGPQVVPTLRELSRDNGWGTVVRVPEGD